MSMIAPTTDTRDPQNAGEGPEWLDFPDLNPNEVDAASKYDEYDLEITYSPAPLKKRYTETPQGTIRWSGYVFIYDDLKKFVIRLPQESHVVDLVGLRGIVEDIRAGHLSNLEWRVTNSKTRHPGEKYRYRSFGRVVKTPEKRVPLGDMIIPCTMAGCQDNGSHHEVLFASDVTHKAECFEGSYGGVFVCRYDDGDGGSTPWGIDYMLNDDTLTAEEASRLANDLAYASATLKTLTERDA